MNLNDDIQIHLADCLVAMKAIPDGSIDCALIDPPYKTVSGGCRKARSKLSHADECTKRTDWVDEARTGKMFKHNSIKFEFWLPELYRVMADRSHTYLMINARNLAELQKEAERVGFKYQNLLIWEKGNFTPNRYYMQGYECILMLRKGGAKNINNKGTSNILSIPNIIGNKKHPSEKPVTLLEVIINNSTCEKEVVLDMFMGSGSTGVACINTGRKFIGIELDSDYFDVAIKRLKEALTTAR